MFKQCKKYVEEYEQELFVALLIILSTSLAFGLGRLTRVEETRTPILVTTTPTSTAAAAQLSGELYVASKTGTKYHLPWCSGATRISPANKITFKTREEAERAGYTPAANCKGL